MPATHLTTLLAGGSYFEAPRWHEGTWWVSDFYRHVVSRVSTSGTEEVITEVEQQPSGLGWLPDGSLLIASMKDHRLLRYADAKLTEHADLSPFCGGDLNDMVVDSTGRAYVGDFGPDLMAAAPTSLKRVDPDGAVTVVAEGLRFPNGSVITPDGRTLIVGETMGNRFTAFDLALDGSVTGRRVWAQLGPEVTGLDHLRIGPDGCALDAEGCIWMADALGGPVLRIAPGGQVTDEVEPPAGQHAFACALGGDDGRTLLLCCAPDALEHNRAPARDALLATMTVTVPGAARAGS
jgi:sugar lactone lactonase YvrE